MKRWLVLLALCSVASTASAQGVVRQKRDETTLWSFYRNAALTAGGSIGGHKLPSGKAFRVQGVGYYVSTSAATATGTQVIRVTDGTNNCDVTFDCTTNDVRSAGSKRGEASGVCVFSPGSALSASITTACGTAQPTVTNVDVVGYWQ